jgi:signal transduction histidine kinase
VTAVVALVVALAGLVLVRRADDRDRTEVDQALAARAAQVRAAATKSGSLPTDGTYVVRLLDASGPRAEKGATTKFSTPVKDGYSTVTASDGSHWRSWAETLKTGAQLQILMDLSEVNKQHSRNVWTINLLLVLAMLLAAAGTWLVGSLVLRPLHQLAEGAQALDPDDPDRRLPEVAGPPEVAELGTAINGALARLSERAADNSAATTATLVAEAGVLLRPPLVTLGDELDQLLDNPDMPATQRHLLLAAIQTEHRQIVTLLDDLEARARGEASR